MRASPAETFAQVYARANRAQQAAMDSVRAARQDVQRAESSLAVKQSALFAQVYAAMVGGVPVRVLAAELEVSTSRIYQIRDEILSHRQEA